ncbi:MAG TPA: P1 family peptidase [Chloroflexota bacterium]|nr:P1 family peptidase [Chloroflexota bacterium]
MGSLLDVPGLRIGHWTGQRTGCTVVLAPPDGAVAGVDVRGGAPATYNVELLRPLNLVERVNALVLSGGSAFGLETCAGVVRWLKEQKAGFLYGGVNVPIVCGAGIFDLSVAEGPPPDAGSGYAACQAASDSESRRGPTGAGAGATVGKALGPAGGMAGGLGMASARAGQHTVAAMAVVNAFGDVVGRHGDIVAGARRPDGSFAGAIDLIAEDGLLRRATPSNTTLAIVATTAPLTREMAVKLAQMAHDGLARAIRPAHTMVDGDIVFSLSVPAPGAEPADVSALGAMAAEAVQDAILDAMRPE